MASREIRNGMCVINQNDLFVHLIGTVRRVMALTVYTVLDSAVDDSDYVTVSDKNTGKVSQIKKDLLVHVYV